MSIEAGRVSLGLDLNSKGVRQQANAMQGELSSVFSGMGKKLGGILTAALSVKAVIDFGKKCLELGSDLEEVQNVVDVTFGSMSSAVNDWAADAISTMGLSEKMAKEFAGYYGAMAKSTGITGDALYDMSTSLTQLAADVASFYNLDPSESYNKLKAIFTGETEGLKSIGVMMTQANLDQFALANGFGKTTASMTEQEKVLLRYQYVMSALSDASGDFARTSGSWANQVKVLKLQFEQLSATIGQTLIAVLTPAIQALNRFMSALIKAANTFKSFVYALLGKKSEDMAAGSGAVADVLGSIADSSDAAAGGISGVGDSVSDANKQIKRSLAGFDEINKLMDTATASSGGGSGGSSGGSSALGDTASALLSEAWDVADEDGPLSKIVERLLGLKDIFKEGFWDGLGDTSVFQSIKDNIDGIKKGLQSIFNAEGVQESVNNYTDSLARMFGTVSGSLASIGASIADNLTGGLSLYLEQHGDEVSTWITTLSDNGTRISDSISSISKSIATIFEAFRSPEGKQFTANMIDLISSPAMKFMEEASDILAEIAETIADLFGTGEDGKSWLTDFFGTMNDGYPILKKIVDFIADGAIDVILAPLRLLRDVLKDIKALWDGIKAVRDFVAGLFGSDESATLSVTAEVTDVKDNIPDSKRKLSNFGATVAQWWNGLKKDSSGVFGWLSYGADVIKKYLGLSADSSGAYGWLTYGANLIKKYLGLSADSSGAYGWLTYGANLIKKYVGLSKDSYGVVGWLSYGADLIKKYIDLSKSDGVYGWLPFGASIKKIWNSITSMWITKAGGGIFSGGSWKPIQSYASGGTPGGGQLFIAREAGPELVGTLGGHTAVMNNDQIVASVSAGVARAIADIKFYATNAATPYLAAIEPSITRSEQYLASMAERAEAEASGGSTARMVTLLQQILEALTTMDFDVKMDGESVKDRIVQLVNAHTQSTGVCEIIT